MNPPMVRRAHTHDVLDGVLPAADLPVVQVLSEPGAGEWVHHFASAVRPVDHSLGNTLGHLLLSHSATQASC